MVDPADGRTDDAVVEAASNAPTRMTEIGKAASQLAEELPHRREQGFRDPRSFEHEAHEYEKWDGDEDLVQHVPRGIATAGCAGTNSRTRPNWWPMKANISDRPASVIAIG